MKDILKTDLNIKKLLNALKYSYFGLNTALKEERAFRQEVVLLVIAIGISFYLGLSITDAGFIIGSVLIVMITEILNSAIENTVNYISKEKHPLAKNAKDLGSAAVFLALCLMALIWVIILYPILFK
jgi:diacylglycerol kinase (ATP)